MRCPFCVQKMAKKNPIRKIKEIEFLFENFDLVTFKANQVKYAHISDIYEEIYIADNRITCNKTADCCEICLFPKADIPITSFVANPISAFKRLKSSNDITQITFSYTDGYTETIHPYWTGMEEFENEAQGCIEKKNGSLIVYIIRGKKKRQSYISRVKD